MTTFHDLLRKGAADHGSRPAIRFDHETLTYADLLAEAEALAGGLQGLGIGPDDRLAIVMDNSMACVVSWMASNLIGAMDVPINPQYRGDLLTYLLTDCAATAVICDAGYLEQIVEVAGRVPSLRQMVVNGAQPVASPLPIVDLASLRGVGGFRSVVGPEHVILYTSGTTGPSKGVLHTQASCLTLGAYNAEEMGYGPEDKLLNFFPLYHQNARYTGVIPALVAGASIRLQKRFSSSTFWKTIDADGITAFNYLGSVLRMIANVTPPERIAGTHTIRTAFGAGSPPAIWAHFETTLGIRFVEVYGLSEAPMSAINVRSGSNASPIGSAGKPSALFEVAVLDEQDNIVAADEIGELCMRPRRPDAMMLGYLNKDAATVRAYRNMWFHSGDRGRMSAEGDIYFEERGKDSIRRRGENISAWEVESILDQHPDVAESAVYGVASEDSDEDVVAALVLKRPDADLAAIVAFAVARLPNYAAPTLIRVMDDLPRTPTAKVQKGELRKDGAAACTLASDL